MFSFHSDPKKLWMSLSEFNPGPGGSRRTLQLVPQPALAAMGMLVQSEDLNQGENVLEPPRLRVALERPLP